MIDLEPRYDGLAKQMLNYGLRLKLGGCPLTEDVQVLIAQLLKEHQAKIDAEKLEQGK